MHVESHTPELSTVVGRREMLAIALVSAGGLFVRMLVAMNSIVAHFDEGVYVLWGAGVDYPGKEFFAPPLFPWLLSRVYDLADPGSVAPFLLNALAGAATIPLIWWLARRWFGAASGLAAGTLVASSGYHTAFSATALTDVTFTFWFVLVIGLMTESYLRAEQSGGWGWALSAGLVAGAAMNTKYNGFLTVLIAGVPAAACMVLPRTKVRIRPTPSALLWGIVAGAAAMLYWPWFDHVNSTVGYSSLLAHQRGYTDGLAMWPSNLATMFLNSRWISPWWGRLGLAAALLVVHLFDRGSLPRTASAWLLIGVALSTGLLFGEAATWCAGSLFLAGRVRSGDWRYVMHAAWLFGLVLLTPMYQPYARLMMPLVAAGWVASAGLARPALEWIESASWLSRVTLAAVAGVAMSLHGVLPVLRVPDGGEPLDDATARALAAIPRGERVALFVRPPVLVHARSEHALELRSSMDWLNAPSAAGSPRYLIVDLPMLRDNASAQEQLDKAGSRLSEIARVAYRPTLPVVLDDFARRPTLWPAPVSSSTYQLVVYSRR